MGAEHEIEQTNDCTIYKPYDVVAEDAQGLPDEYADEPDAKVFFQNDFTTDPQGDLSTENADIVDTVGYSVITGEGFVNGHITEHGLQTTDKTGIILDSVPFDQPVIIEGWFTHLDEVASISIHSKTDYENGVESEYALVQNHVCDDSQFWISLTNPVFYFRAIISGTMFLYSFLEEYTMGRDVSRYSRAAKAIESRGFGGDKVCVVISGQTALKNLTVKSLPPLSNTLLFNNNFQNDPSGDLSGAITEETCHPDLEVYADTAGDTPVICQGRGLFFPSSSHLYIDNVDTDKPVYISASFSFLHTGEDITRCAGLRHAGLGLAEKHHRYSLRPENIGTNKRRMSFSIDAALLCDAFQFNMSGAKVYSPEAKYPSGALAIGSYSEITLELIIRDGLLKASALSNGKVLCFYEAIIKDPAKTIAIMLSEGVRLTHLKIAGESCTKKPVDFPELSGLDVLIEQDFLSAPKGAFNIQDSEVFNPKLLCLTDHSLSNTATSAITGLVTDNGLEGKPGSRRRYNYCGFSTHNSIKPIDITKPFLISGAFKIVGSTFPDTPNALLKIHSSQKVEFHIKDGGNALYVFNVPILKVKHFSDFIGKEIAFKIFNAGGCYYIHIKDVQTNETLYSNSGLISKARIDIRYFVFSSAALTHFSVKGSVLELPELPQVAPENILYYNNFLHTHEQEEFDLNNSEIVDSSLSPRWSRPTGWSSGYRYSDEFCPISGNGVGFRAGAKHLGTHKLCTTIKPAPECITCEADVLVNFGSWGGGSAEVYAGRTFAMKLINDLEAHRYAVLITTPDGEISYTLELGLAPPATYLLSMVCSVQRNGSSTTMNSKIIKEGMEIFTNTLTVEDTGTPTSIDTSVSLSSTSYLQRLRITNTGIANG